MPKGIKEGRKLHPLYSIWRNMRLRCLSKRNRQFPDYGGRGITIAPAWDDFWRFVKDMGPRPSSRHSLDRIDNDCGYGPDNCRWATPEQQNRNTRRTKMISHQGKTMCVVDWAAEFGVHPSAMWHRFRKHGIERAMNMGAKETE